MLQSRILLPSLLESDYFQLVVNLRPSPDSQHIVSCNFYGNSHNGYLCVDLYAVQPTDRMVLQCSRKVLQQQLSYLLPDCRVVISRARFSNDADLSVNVNPINVNRVEQYPLNNYDLLRGIWLQGSWRVAKYLTTWQRLSDS
jgi:hypothetical protein